MFPKVLILASLATLASSMQYQTTMGFTVHHSAEPYAVSAQTYLSKHPKPGSPQRVIMTAAYAVDTSAHPPRILLVQRALGDSKPGLWETPGGRVDPADRTILHGLERELREEAGLVATRVGPLVSQYSFPAGRKVFTKCNFLVEAARHGHEGLAVRLDPKEHQDHVWATEAEVMQRRVERVEGRGHVHLAFTSQDQERAILQAFEVRRGHGDSS